MLDANGEEIDLKQSTDDDMGFAPSDEKAFSSVNDAETAGGYGVENEDADIFAVDSDEYEDDSDVGEDADDEDIFDDDIFSESEELDDYDD